MRLALLLSYPLLVHLSVAWSSPSLQWAAMQCLFAGLFLNPLRNGAVRAWLALAAFAGGTLLLTHIGGGLYALYAPPLVMPSLVLSAFATSLLPGHVPLVTRMAEEVRGSLSADLRQYTRSVTWLWTMLLAAIVALTCYLMLFGPVRAWSVFTNFAVYGLLGGVFVGEYVYRRLRFRNIGHAGFVAHLRQVATTRIR
jgi:uncharacterized membrane protein